MYRIYALSFLLTYNAFNLGINGMGTPVAPTFADLFLAHQEERFVHNVKNPFIKYIKYWSTFIDDVLVIWSGTEEQYNEFIRYINDSDVNISFTANYRVEFLDIQIILQNNDIVTKDFRKPTATNALLDHNSFHPHI